MPKEAAAPAQRLSGRGSLGGGLNASAVDTDRLWRDRITQELTFQRSLKRERDATGNNSSADLLLGMSTRSSARTASQQGTPTTARNVNFALNPTNIEKLNNSNNNNSGDQQQQQASSPASARSTRSAQLVESLLQSTKVQPTTPSGGGSQVGLISTAIDISEIEPKDLAALQRELQHAQYMSTARASYKFNRSRLLELSATGGHRYGKKTFKYQ